MEELYLSFLSLFSTPTHLTGTNSPKASSQTKSDVEVKKISSGLMLAQYYNSDSESEDECDVNSNSGSVKPIKENISQQQNEDSQSSIASIPSLGENTTIPPGIAIPPAELRVIIDKTAAYVLKNGKEFEDILRIKNDERFRFLKYTDQYYKYYTYKVTGTVVSDPIILSTPNKLASNNGDKSGKLDGLAKNDKQSSKKLDPPKAIGKFIEVMNKKHKKQLFHIKHL